MKKSPKVVALLNQLATLRLSKGWTIEDLRTEINAHLAKPIPGSKNGRAQLDRWIHTVRRGWVEPRGEIVLAIQEVVNSHHNTLVNENQSESR
jgi:hypothetical protein